MCAGNGLVPRGSGQGRPRDIPDASPIARILDPEKTGSKLRGRRALLAAALKSLPDGVLMLDLAGKALAYNRKFAEMWRISAAGCNHSALMRVASRARNPHGALDKIRAISATPDAESRAALELKDGRVVEFCSGPHTMNGTRLGTVFSFRDVTEAKRAEADLRHCASHDPLTRLPNRALLFDRIGQAIAQAQRHRTQLALLFIDLNQFRRVNNAYGHHAGDRVLFETGKRLVSCVRREDTAGRLGGDEFVVLLSEVAKGEDAAIVAVKVLQALSHPFVVAGRQIFTGASIGISLFPDHAGDVETLLARADDAMYRAKESGHASYRTFRLATNSADTSDTSAAMTGDQAARFDFKSA